MERDNIRELKKQIRIRCYGLENSAMMLDIKDFKKADGSFLEWLLVVGEPFTACFLVYQRQQ